METPTSVVLGDTTFDLVRATLHGPSGTVVLRRKSLELLQYLVDRPDTVITKDELLHALWPDVMVGEDSVAQCISEIRRGLGPKGRDVIKTMPRRGYLLSIPDGSTAAARSTPVVIAGGEHLPLPVRPSIAVLPFTNFGGRTDEEYFSDGVSEDIITELSRFSELAVIARNSSFQYKGKSLDVRQIGRALGVQYILEGSIRREKNKLRITAQLIEAQSGRHRWAERYDRTFANALKVQDEVARTIVAVLAVQVNKAETERVLAKPPAVWQAYGYYLRAAVGVASYHASYDRQHLFGARNFLEQALTIDPNYARAHAALSSIYISQWVHRWDDTCPWANALELAYQAARESVRLAPDMPEAHVALGQALTFLRQHDAALSAVERAISLNTNMTSFRFSYILVLSGDAARAVQLLEAHMRLDPFYQPNAPAALGFAYYVLRRYAQALPHLQEAISRAPNMAHGHLILAMTYARLGELDKAKEEAAHALALEPWYRISRSLTANYFKRPEDAEHLVGALRKAGFPE